VTPQQPNVAAGTPIVKDRIFVSTTSQPHRTHETRETHETPRGYSRRVSTETKASFKTTELIAYLAAVVGVLVASAMVDGDEGFSAEQAWFFVTLLTIGYMVSRGLAKSGSREPYDDTIDH
jgi:hypothetical protein